MMDAQKEAFWSGCISVMKKLIYQHRKGSPMRFSYVADSKRGAQGFSSIRLGLRYKVKDESVQGCRWGREMGER